MDEKKIMMAALEMIGWGREGLAQRAGYAGATAITNKLQTKKSMRVDTFVKIMAAMGYEVVVRSISRSNKSEWAVSYDNADDKAQEGDE